ncbi:MAG: DUF790 family protein, partial [Polyangia bacterium]|nr:DUF790 family protein [Polyangia bacterium]
DELVPGYLREPDFGWLRALIDAYTRHVGRPVRELNEHLEAPLVSPAPAHRLRLARHVLGRQWATLPAAKLPAAKAREALFAAAAARPEAPRRELLGQVARRLRVSPAALEEALFADLPGERRLGPAPEGMEPGELALRVNLAMAQGLLGRARELRIHLVGQARAVVRQARWGGLLCQVRPRDPEGSAVLEISGPLALFRRARVYGRTLAALVPLLPRCQRFALLARCEVGGAERVFRLQTGDPVFPSQVSPGFDSRVERRFAEEFSRLALDWDLLREPEPVGVGDQLIFPDFALVHRRQGWRRWLLEIMGFWTREYVERKLDLVRGSGLSRLILAVDSDLQGDLGELPPGVRVLRYRRRLAPEDLLGIIEPEGSWRPGER